MKGEIAYCSTCDKKFNTIEIGLRALEQYNSNSRLHQFPPTSLLSVAGEMTFDTSFDLWSTKKGSSTVMDKINDIIIQNKRSYLLHDNNFNVDFLVNYARNIHSSCHATSCFKKGCECRHRFPRKPRLTTDIVDTGEEIIWYAYNGTSVKHHIHSIEQKRSSFDIFSNTYCPVNLIQY